MSHSVIFQLYSDGTVVQYPTFPAEHPTPRAVRGLLRADPTPTQTPERPKKPPCHRMPTRDDSTLLIHNQARYLYATVAGFIG